jgi:hypothetical protein
VGNREEQNEWKRRNAEETKQLGGMRDGEWRRLENSVEAERRQEIRVARVEKSDASINFWNLQMIREDHK